MGAEWPDWISEFAAAEALPVRPAWPELPSPDEEEVSEVGWFTGDEVNHLVKTDPESVSPSFALVWSELLRRG